MEHERILYILDYLNRCTDENHGVTIQDIRSYLAKETGMQDVAVLTIRRDLERIERANADMSYYTGAHNTRYYYIRQRGFSFNEIRFLVDSVSINKFMSPQKKQRLIKKFEVLCSEAQVRQLISRVSLDGRETPSYDLLENLERIHAVISERQKIIFDYGKSDLKGNLTYYKKDREMIPCKVIYFNERFYLKCINEETGAVRTYRVDRMRGVRGGAKVRRRPELPKTEAAILDMFEPESIEVVRLRVRRVLLDEMLEMLGKFAIAEDDPEHEDCVIIRANIAVSQNFSSWVMRYGEKVEVLAPPDLREKMREHLLSMMQLYDDAAV